MPSKKELTARVNEATRLLTEAANIIDEQTAWIKALRQSASQGFVVEGETSLAFVSIPFPDGTEYFTQVRFLEKVTLTPSEDGPDVWVVEINDEAVFAGSKEDARTAFETIFRASGGNEAS